jgi:cytidine deaminase
MSGKKMGAKTGAKMNDKLGELFLVATRARDNSYSPYSGHKVGAAIRLQDGKIFSGCNVENSSFGATICAERVAIQKAVSECGKISILEVMVVTDATPPWPPCGLCRQVIAEFGAESTIYAANLSGDVKKMSFAELLPEAFTPQHLSKISQQQAD